MKIVCFCDIIIAKKIKEIEVMKYDWTNIYQEFANELLKYKKQRITRIIRIIFRTFAL